ncbi:MAG: hypothetical protein A3H98_01385 [Bacteroidetes bacterium RIFCSPLOWO2_02_FULL_36_8]|nr:MAG: hypothetical protein A3H98_01385 [Bacteroidetes bacterium RIFCSPLOWO2_02_FULL_36_8]OFY70903.1 MAG: hypothetical protein A3G23_12345 [Bacteroidetes bacterium RIFCSPLOWO2_12_FULL_37_12]
MKTRIFSGIAFGVIMIASIWYSEWSYLIIFGLLTGLGIYEFYSLLANQDIHPSKVTGIIIGLAWYALVFLYVKNSETSSYLILLLLLLPLLAIPELYRKQHGSFRNFLGLTGGIIYLAGGFSALHFIAYASGNYSYETILGFIFLQWSADTFAYFSGALFGKHKLFERISPKKTWEGSVGGAVMTILISFILSKYILFYSTMDWIIISILVVIFGAYGDLCESMLKRNLNIKDSGTLIPGHGGILDRFDGLLFSAPAVAAYLLLVGA